MLRKMFWNQKAQFMVVRGIELQLLYFESKPDLNIEPLAFECSKANGCLQVNLEDVTQRFWPTLENFFREMEEKVAVRAEGEEADDDAERAALMDYLTDKLTLISDNISETSSLPRIFEIVLNNASDIVMPIAGDMVAVTKCEYVRLGRKLSGSLMDSSRINSVEYEKIRRRLVNQYELIRPLLSLVWCEKCVKQTESYYAIGPRDPPISLCPVCGSEMGTATTYYFSKPLASMFKARDGIIGLNVFWALNASNIEWAPGVLVKGLENDSEKDALYKIKDSPGYGLVEVKLHALNASERSIEENIRKDLRLLQGKYHKLIEAKINIETISLVINFPQPEALTLVTKALGSAEFREIKGKAKVFFPENFEEFVEMISGGDLS